MTPVEVLLPSISKSASYSQVRYPISSHIADGLSELIVLAAGVESLKQALASSTLKINPHFSFLMTFRKESLLMSLAIASSNLLIQIYSEK